ncbi:hypothetical protein I3760_07G060800 [Carya illinoinensis]|nr:hypothetical protein I3760_07G060800 [Carya illinoinensis]
MRNNVVVLSSDGEDSDYSLTSNRSFSKPKSRLLVTRSNPRGAKKARLSGSRPHSSKEPSKLDEIRYYYEDFDEVYNGFKVSAGLRGSNTQGLWVDKYKPRSLEELAVHKKKVEEVKVWFEDRLRSSKEKLSNQVLVITGQAGVGKSATIHTIASHLGVRVCEWNTPTPIIWQEHLHNSSTDLTARCFEELQLCLESAGACKVAFNPITHNSIKRTLSRICRQERCNVAADQIDLIANASGGDIRHAITSLQFLCVKPDPMHSLSICDTITICSREKPDVFSALDDGSSLQFGRDESLSLFHALGKFLHNKRDSQNGMELEQAEFIVKERLSRLPLKMHAPEKILCQAHGQARPIADFLHENVLDFLSEEAIDDAWAVASYLGDADLLLATFRGMLSRYNEAENVLQSAAASVAARGVLFGNSHPLPSRWHSIRRPKLWQIERSLLHNKNEMAKCRFDGCSGINLSDMSIVATEYTPVFKWLGYGTTGGLETHQVSMQSDITEDYFDKMKLEDKESETTDDEIEDW